MNSSHYIYFENISQLEHSLVTPATPSVYITFTQILVSCYSFPMDFFASTLAPLQSIHPHNVQNNIFKRQIRSCQLYCTSYFNR